MKLQGLSLSFCVTDIVTGKIPLEAVEKIYCGFAWDGSVSELYYETYWRNLERSAVAQVFERIEIEPNLTEFKNIARGHWMLGDVTRDRLEDGSDRIQAEEASILAEIQPEGTRAFDHDCKACVFLGHCRNRDLYYCDYEPTIVARYGNRDSDYGSGLHYADKPLHLAGSNDLRWSLRVAWLLARSMNIVMSEPSIRSLYPDLFK